MPRFKHQKQKGNYKGRVPKQYTLRGVSGSLRDIYAAFSFPVTFNTLRKRLQTMTLEEAYMTPANEEQRRAGRERSQIMHAARRRAKAEKLKCQEPVIMIGRSRHPPEIIKKYMIEVDGCLILR